MKLYKHQPASETLEACNRLIREIEGGIEDYVSRHEDDFDRLANRFKDIDPEELEMALLEDREVIDGTLHLIQQVIMAHQDALEENTDEINREYQAEQYNQKMQRRASNIDIAAGVN